MIFLALILTLHMHLPQCPLAHTDLQDLRRDLLKFLRLAEPGIGEECLQVALLKHNRHQTVVRITLVEDRQLSALTTLVNCLAAASPLLLCNRRYEITAMDVSDPQWAGISTWADMEAKEKGSHINFTFATPLLTAAPGEPDVLDALPFPEPLPLFSRLEEQWYRHRGPQLGCSVDEMVHQSRCVIADYHLRTVEVPLSGRPHIGYLGSITYEYLRPCISPLHALARLAFFTGSGYGTDHGMGVTRVVIPGRA